jgi:hypothetical protein
MTTSNKIVNKAIIKESAKALVSGQKLLAIKILKTRWKIGLKDCKDILDNVYPEYYCNNSKWISRKKLRQVRKLIKKEIIYDYSLVRVIY